MIAENPAVVEPPGYPWPTYYPIHMPPLYHRDFLDFRAQVQADQEAGLWRPHVTFGRWMAARLYLSDFRNPVPRYPPRRPILNWGNYPAAHYFLMGFLDEYESFGSSCARRVFLWHVTGKLLMDGFIMGEFEEDGFSFGDVRRVSKSTGQSLHIGC